MSLACCTCPLFESFCLFIANCSFEFERPLLCEAHQQYSFLTIDARRKFVHRAVDHKRLAEKEAKREKKLKKELGEGQARQAHALRLVQTAHLQVLLCILRICPTGKARGREDRGREGARTAAGLRNLCALVWPSIDDSVLRVCQLAFDILLAKQ